MAKIYICNECEWQGTEKELEYEPVESCMGNLDIEVCPKCGSMDIKEIADKK